MSKTKCHCEKILIESLIKKLCFLVTDKYEFDYPAESNLL